MDLAHILLTLIMACPFQQEESGPHWTVLEPVQTTSEAGATFETMSDASIFVSGENAEKDVYVIEYLTDLAENILLAYVSSHRREFPRVMREKTRSA